MKRRKRIIIIALLLIIGLIGAAYAFGFFDKKVEKNEEQKHIYRSQLTGEEVSQEESERPILGIMIENSQEARPQAGLDSAGIVFETVTEGGITRYLALFQEDMPAEVGPVRSIRPYFVDWAMGFDASIAHVGGSAEALEMVKNRNNAKSLNQFSHSKSYYRVNNRAAPHNMYARTQDLRELQKEENHKKSSFKEIPRSDDSPSATPDATNIKIDFSRPLFQAEFRYDQTTNSYTRYLAGQPHVDAATNQPITVKNLIVLKMPAPSINTIGSGEALVFKNGSIQKGTWKQSDFNNRLEILDAQSNPILLNRGNTWISATPSGRSITY
ncbi:MAG TPA: DUF3048 domain-containing protein [Patescibacteria group bacterium]|nr:DUF3048 domain-containing protein [Patescibacteria group bacterium]